MHACSLNQIFRISRSNFAPLRNSMGGQNLFFGFSMPPLGEGQEGGVTHREAEAKSDTGDTDL